MCYVDRHTSSMHHVHAHLFGLQGKVVFFVNTLLITKLLPCPCPRRLEYQVHSVDEV